MKFKTKIIYSALFSSGMLIASILYPLVPCKRMANVPNPDSHYSICTLNPDVSQSLDSIVNYFGYTTQLTTAYFVVLFSSFLLAMIFFHFTSRKAK